LIGLDTNVVVRYVMQDDARQAAIATRLFERTLSAEHPGFLSAIVLCEVAWVLETSYGATREALHEVLRGLLQSRVLVIEYSGLALKALRFLERSAGDFPGAFIGQIALERGAAKCVTFDREVAKLPGFEMLA